jgi:signal transduction histidine kinase
VRAVGEAHGGSLAIEPRPEGGLTVLVRFPTAGAARAAGSRERRLRGAPA